MSIIKDHFIKKCLQPGVRGIDARKQMNTAWKWFGWIPIYRWFIRWWIPTEEEIEEAMEQQNRYRL